MPRATTYSTHSTHSTTTVDVHRENVEQKAIADDDAVAAQAKSAYNTLHGLLNDLNGECKRLEVEISHYDGGHVTTNVAEVSKSFHDCWTRSVSVAQKVSHAYETLAGKILPLCAETHHSRQEKLSAVNSFTDTINSYLREVESVKQTFTEIIGRFNSSSDAFCEWAVTKERSCKTQVERIRVEVEKITVRIDQLQTELTTCQSSITDTNTILHNTHNTSHSIHSPPKSTISISSGSSESTAVHGINGHYTSASEHRLGGRSPSHNAGVHPIELRLGAHSPSHDYGPHKPAGGVRFDGGIEVPKDPTEKPVISIESASATKLPTHGRDITINTAHQDTALVTLNTRVGGYELPITMIICVPQILGTMGRPIDVQIPITVEPTRPYTPPTTTTTTTHTSDRADKIRASIQELIVEKSRKTTEIEKWVSEERTIRETRIRVESRLKRDLTTFGTSCKSILAIWDSCHGDLQHVKTWIGEGVHVVEQPRYMRVSVTAAVSCWKIMKEYLSSYGR